jgi:hypothetical protein
MVDIFPITSTPLGMQSGGSLVLVLTVGGSPGGSPGGNCQTGL